jgi:hypothetical protein
MLTSWGNIEPEIMDTKNEEICWRYLTIEKFIDFMITGDLVFVRTDQLTQDPLLGDKFEGQIARVSDSIILETSRKVYEIIKAIVPDSSAEEWHKNTFSRLKEETFVNCWTLDESESLAMWMIYCRGQGGVALRSSVGKLRQLPCLPGRVIYIDHDRYDDHNLDYRGIFFRKRKHFSYEREYRLLIENKDNAAPVQRVHVNWDDIVDEILISPYTPPWFRPRLERLAEVIGVRTTFSLSSFNDAPQW